MTAQADTDDGHWGIAPRLRRYFVERNLVRVESVDHVTVYWYQSVPVHRHGVLWDLVDKVTEEEEAVVSVDRYVTVVVWYWGGCADAAWEAAVLAVVATHCNPSVVVWALVPVRPLLRTPQKNPSALSEFQPCAAPQLSLIKTKKHYQYFKYQAVDSSEQKGRAILRS